MISAKLRRAKIAVPEIYLFFKFHHQGSIIVNTQWCQYKHQCQHRKFIITFKNCTFSNSLLVKKLCKQLASNFNCIKLLSKRPSLNTRCVRNYFRIYFLTLLLDRATYVCCSWLHNNTHIIHRATFLGWQATYTFNNKNSKTKNSFLTSRSFVS